MFYGLTQEVLNLAGIDLRYYDQLTDTWISPLANGEDLNELQVKVTQLGLDVEAAVEDVGEAVSSVESAVQTVGIMQQTVTNLQETVTQNQQTVTEHLAERASLTKEGHVQLQTSLDNSESRALTPKALNDYATNIRTGALTVGDSTKFNGKEDIKFLQSKGDLNSDLQNEIGNFISRTTSSDGVVPSYSVLLGFNSGVGSGEYHLQIVANNNILAFRMAGDGTPYQNTFTYAITSHNVKIGHGSPEGIVTASPGVLYLNQNGGANTTLYVKQAGAGNTGWVAK